MSKLTKTDLDALHILADGRSLFPTVFARKLGIPPTARGNYCRRFRRLYENGFASIALTNDGIAYHITNAGRAALKEPANG